MTETEMRELDAWIAEHVIGWSYEVTGSDPTEDGYCWFDENRKFPCELPHYSTDPAAAMQVLEKCAERSAIMIIKDDGCVVAQINGKRLTADGPTLPLAICQFARKLFEK